MSSPVIIQYLALDAGNDPVFDPSLALTNGEAVAQAVLTRLRLFMGEWWEDLNLGLPVFQSMLGQPSTQATQNAVRTAVQNNIAGAPYVTGGVSVSVSFANGALSVMAYYNSVFGPQTSQLTLPALSASLGAS